MFKQTFLLVISFFICCNAVGQIAFAAPAISIPQSHSQTQTSSAALYSSVSASRQLAAFRLQPRFNAWGFVGSGTLVEGQFLVPVFGDNERALFVATEADYNHIHGDDSDTWLGGAGVGYRQVVDERIWGGYVLADHVSAAQNSFTLLKPGGEMLGQIWDLRVNGYFPLDNRKKLSNSGWAGDDFGDYAYVRCAGHACYDRILQQYAQLGRGADFEVARIIPYREDIKLHVGAYHFDTLDLGSINGAKISLTYDLNKYSSIELRDSYDNYQHHQFFAGLRFTLGGYSKEEKQKYGSAARLMDPIAPHGSMTVNLVKRYVNQGEFKEHDNVWFFRQAQLDADAKSNSGGAPQRGNGTAEDPFSGFTPANYGAINPNGGVIDRYPLMYFAPGSYNFAGFSSRGIDGRFSLPDGWGMYGRSVDYARSPAMDDERALFSHGGIDIDAGNTQTTLHSVRILNDKDGRDNAVIHAVNVHNIILHNVDSENSFTAVSGVANYTEVYGIYAENSTLNFTGRNTVTANAAVKAAAADAAEAGGITTAAAYGIWSYHSILNFAGAENIIIGRGTSSATSAAPDDAVIIYGYGYGINAMNDSQIKFEKGVNIIAGIGSATATFSGISVDDDHVDGPMAFAIGSSIHADTGSAVYFNGGVNNLSGAGVATSAVNVASIYGDVDSVAFGSGYGIDAASGAKVYFNGGTNVVTGAGISSAAVSAANIDGTVRSQTSSYVVGINASNADLYFNGGMNVVTAAALGSTKVDAANIDGTAKVYVDDLEQGFGIDANFSTVNFNGGMNSVKGTAIGKGEISAECANNSSRATIVASSIGEAYGIYAENNSSVGFFLNSPEQKVNIDADGTAVQDGIWASLTSHIEGNGAALTSDTVKNYINFARKPTSSPTDLAIFWETHFIYDWPPSAG